MPWQRHEVRERELEPRPKPCTREGIDLPFPPRPPPSHGGGEEERGKAVPQLGMREGARFPSLVPLPRGKGTRGGGEGRVPRLVYLMKKGILLVGDWLQEREKGRKNPPGPSFLLGFPLPNRRKGEGERESVAPTDTHRRYLGEEECPPSIRNR